MLNRIAAVFLVLFLTSCFEEKEIKIINHETQNPDSTIITFQESAHKEVMQDAFKAVLRFEVNGKDVVDLQNQINSKMQEAVKIAKAAKELDVSTGNYSVNKQWDNNSKQYVGYTAFQEIILDSKNKENLLKTAQQLQALGLIMNNLQSYLSVEKTASYRNELIEEALNRVKQRAEVIAKNLQKKEVNISRIDINSANHRPYLARSVKALSMAANVEMADPVVEPAKQDVSVNISVTVNLED
ncbi:MAG: SIMPL domain-containing protein [Proteobacteria bacterium]|nr:SIMPL domain-containing protein [Pseudomonadota bacterium]